jgi:hypothetical protein
MKLHAQDARRPAGALAVVATAAGLVITGCGASSGSGTTAATTASGASPASSGASSASSAPVVVSAGSLPFPTTVGDTWAYSNSNGSTSVNKIASSTPVSAGQQVTMAITIATNGAASHASYDYIVQPNGQISLPVNEFTSTGSASGVSIKVLSGGIFWPSAAQLANNQSVASTLEMEFTIAGKTDKVAEHITSTGEGTQSVTVPAGTYRASVVSTVESMVFEGYNTTIDDKTWLAAGVGPVQSELIDVDGKTLEISNKQELTSFVKG